jgi:hypothetical protein
MTNALLVSKKGNRTMTFRYSASGSEIELLIRKNTPPGALTLDQVTHLANVIAACVEDEVHHAYEQAVEDFDDEKYSEYYEEGYRAGRASGIASVKEGMYD